MIELAKFRIKSLSTLLWVGVLLILSAGSAPAQCSGERWPVKIGTDPGAATVNLNSPTATSIANLIAIATPKSLQTSKRVQPTETTVYVLNAIVKKYARMFDSDYHMVIADASGRTMIAEIPSPACVNPASPFAAGIAHARAQFDAMFNVTSTFQTADVPVRITGVGFFDYLEGQAGQAPNGVELHPVIDITFDSNFSLSASPSSLTVAQGASGTSTINSAISGSFNSAISMSVSGLPAAATADFSPPSIVAPGTGPSVLTISVGPATPPGTYNLTVNGTGGGQTHSATINLTVPSGGSTSQLLGNPGFENGSSSPAPWTVTAGVIDNTSFEAPHTGSWKAWLNGYGSAHTDIISQTVSLPADASNISLSFWLHIDTLETAASAADTLAIQVRNSSGALLSTLANYSNLNANAGYTQVLFDLTAYKGQTLQIYLLGVENGSLKTSFVVDDFSLSSTLGGAPADFAIASTPSALTIAQGGSATASITTTASGGFNSAIALSASGLPAGATTSFSPAAIAAPGAGSSTFTISAGSATATGTYNVIVNGSGGGKTHSTTISLIVSASSGGTTLQLLGNPGFESGSASPAPWVVSAGVIDNSSFQPPHSGLWKAWLNGYGSVHTDTLLQSVTIPSTATGAALSFWLHVDTAETSTTRAYDTLTVQVRNPSGTVLATLATYSNLDAAPGYAQFSFDLAPYKGQAIQIYLVGVEDSSLKTGFLVDDFTLNVTTP
jgi:hypothetical protein